MDEPFGALDALTRRNLQDELLRIWQELGKTILFVTHGIDESVYLASRVIVMTHRPGQIKKIVPIDMPRPRNPNSLSFNSLEQQLGELVAEEQHTYSPEAAALRRQH
jgi:NitT/TauT family transport system ATP-binding protein